MTCKLQSTPWIKVWTSAICWILNCGGLQGQKYQKRQQKFPDIYGLYYVARVGSGLPKVWKYFHHENQCLIQREIFSHCSQVLQDPNFILLDVDWLISGQGWERQWSSPEKGALLHGWPSSPHTVCASYYWHCHHLEVDEQAKATHRLPMRHHRWAVTSP